MNSLGKKQDSKLGQKTKKISDITTTYVPTDLNQ